jgi:hypothetical protein
LSNVTCFSSPIFKRPVSKVLFGAGDDTLVPSFVPVAVWSIASWFLNVTVVPALTVILPGP